MTKSRDASLAAATTVTPASLRPPRVRPYPLDALPRLLRAQVELSQILWQHLGALLAASHVSTPEGRAALERSVGGVLRIDAQAPYLVSGERLPALFQSSVAVEVCRVAASAQRFLVAVDGLLARTVGVGDSQRLADLLQTALRGAGVQVTPLDASALAAVFSEPLWRAPLVLDAGVRIGPVAGWARVLASSSVRLSAPPKSGPDPLRLLWLARERLAGTSSQLVWEAGYGFLRSSEVLGLAAGDVVLMDHFGPRPVTGGPVWLRLGGGVFPGHLDGAGVTVIGSFYLRAQAMADQQSDEAVAVSETGDAVNESLLRELPVQITCEIGRVTLSAKEVLELRPGAVLPVGRPLAGPVDLTAGGRVLARGELVDVEGEIGVRITEIVS
jgi:type III secretion system YscQ/HrcQ family protein